MIILYRPHTGKRFTDRSREQIYITDHRNRYTDHTLKIDIQIAYGNRYTDHSLGTDKKTMYSGTYKHRINISMEIQTTYGTVIQISHCKRQKLTPLYNPHTENR